MTKFVSQLLALLVLFIGLSGYSSHTAAGSFLDGPSSSLDDLVLSDEPKFLPVDEAFEFTFAQTGDELILTWTIAPNYYLYRDKIKFATVDATIGEITYPPSETIEDEYFGTSAIYRNEVSLVVPLTHVGPNAELKVKYQGCAEAGLCYPPTKKLMPLIALDGKTQSPATDKQTNDADDGVSQASDDSADAGAPLPVSEQTRLAQMLADSNFIVTLILFFGFGVGLAFTPCLFPMYPIITSIIAGQGNKMTPKYGLLLSFIYVQGMALTYSLLGLVVASAGMKFQAYFQQPSVLIGFSLLFVVLALSMFGWIDFKMPASWNQRLTNLSNKQKGGSLAGVFVMGALSGLIASPCTSAPLAGALAYIAKSGDAVLGTVTLYVLSLGMGVPLLLLGASGGKLLPKAGQWMNVIKNIFGFLLLSVPLLLLDRIIDISYTMTAAAALTIVFCIYLYTVAQSIQSATTRSITSFMTIGLFVVAVLTIHQTWFAPTKSMQDKQTQSNVSLDEHGFIDIKSLADLQQQLELAKAENKPLMIDLYADWCIACKEFETYTFSDPKVQSLMSQFRLVRADVTANDQIDIELLENFDIRGLPSLLFFDKNANELTTLRVTGFVKAEPFAQHLSYVLKR